MFWLQHLRYEALIKLTRETSWLQYPWIRVAQIPSKIIVRLSCYVDDNVNEDDNVDGDENILSLQKSVLNSKFMTQMMI